MTILQSRCNLPKANDPICHHNFPRRFFTTIAMRVSFLRFGTGPDKHHTAKPSTAVTNLPTVRCGTDAHWHWKVRDLHPRGNRQNKRMGFHRGGVGVHSITAPNPDYEAN